MTAPVVQSDTTHLYESIPEYIQDWDASNGYQLLLWLDGICTMLQNVDDWSRDDLTNNLVGWARLFDYNLYYNATSMNIVRQALMVLPWFAQFTGTKLSQIPPISIPDTDTDAQAAGRYSPYINNWITQITSVNGFERGTLTSFVNSLATYLENKSGTVVSADSFQILEKTNVISNGSNVFVTDPYSIIALVPSALVPNNTYFDVYMSDTYANYQTTYVKYSGVPNTVLSIQNFANHYAPAGLSVTVLPI